MCWVNSRNEFFGLNGRVAAEVQTLGRQTNRDFPQQVMALQFCINRECQNVNLSDWVDMCNPNPTLPTYSTKHF
jgi:hypothetical protein